LYKIFTKYRNFNLLTVGGGPNYEAILYFRSMEGNYINAFVDLSSLMKLQNSGFEKMMDAPRIFSTRVTRSPVFFGYRSKK
jgi:hypothetical protein